MKGLPGLEHMLRVTARCLRLPRLLRPVGSRCMDSPLSVAELDKAFLTCVNSIKPIIKLISFLAIIQQGCAPCRKGRLTSLSPFIDSDSVLRVGVSLHNSRLPYEQWIPPLLPKGSHLVQLITERVYRTALHGGHSVTYAHAMRKAWILGRRAQACAYVRQCVTCARVRARRAAQMMGDLSAARVEPVRDHFSIEPTKNVEHVVQRLI